MEKTAATANIPCLNEETTLLSLVVKKNLPLPSLCRARLCVKKPKIVSNLIERLNIHEKTFDGLNNILRMEMALLSKIGYKYSCSYRPFPFWCAIRRILQCCKRINVLNVPGLFFRLLNSLKDFEPAERLTYLPSLRLVEYVLIRLIGAVSLFGTTASYSSKAFVNLKRSLSGVGQNIPQHVLMISLSSRLWSVCNSIAKELIEVYTAVFKLRKCLLSSVIGQDEDQKTNICSSYIPDSEKFPKDLYLWLQKHIETCVIDFEKPDISKDLWLKKTLKEMQKISEIVSEKKTNSSFITDEDIGQPV